MINTEDNNKPIVKTYCNICLTTSYCPAGQTRSRPCEEYNGEDHEKKTNDTTDRSPMLN